MALRRVIGWPCSQDIGSASLRPSVRTTVVSWRPPCVQRRRFSSYTTPRDAALVRCEAATSGVGLAVRRAAAWWAWGPATRTPRLRGRRGVGSNHCIEEMSRLRPDARGIDVSSFTFWQTWQRPTLPRLETKYHRRWGVSRPSSEWDRVQPPRHSHQVSKKVKDFWSCFWHPGMPMRASGAVVHASTRRMPCGHLEAQAAMSIA